MILNPYKRQSGGGGGAIVQQDAVTGSHAAYKTSLNLPALDCSAADAVVICSYLYLGGSVTSITDSDGDTYVKLGNYLGGSRSWVSIWSAVSITQSASKVITVTYSGSKSKGGHCAVAYSGVDQTTPLYDYQSTGAADPSLGITTGADADAVTGMASGYSLIPTIADPTGTGQIEIWAALFNSFGISVCEKLAAGAGVNTFSWTMASGTWYATNCCAIKAAT